MTAPTAARATPPPLFVGPVNTCTRPGSVAGRGDDAVAEELDEADAAGISSVGGAAGVVAEVGDMLARRVAVEASCVGDGTGCEGAVGIGVVALAVGVGVGEVGWPLGVGVGVVGVPVGEGSVHVDSVRTGLVADVVAPSGTDSVTVFAKCRWWGESQCDVRNATAKVRYSVFPAGTETPDRSKLAS